MSSTGQYANRSTARMWLLASALAVVTGDEALARQGCVGNDQVIAIGQEELALIASIKAGRCDLIPRYLRLVERERALVLSHRSPTCTVTIAPAAPRGMFYDGIYNNGAPPLNSFSNYCGAAKEGGQDRSSAGGSCEGRISTSEYSTRDQNCLVINNQCGVPIRVGLDRTDHARGESRNVDSAPATFCSYNLKWKYTLRDYSIRKSR